MFEFFLINLYLVFFYSRFQRIVAALLPGVDAKLEVPPNAANILEGLQVAVSRGADRQSLSQMPVPEGSVVALSLLLGLSLQKEREAKLYLLDLVSFFSLLSKAPLCLRLFIIYVFKHL